MAGDTGSGIRRPRGCGLGQVIDLCKWVLVRKRLRTTDL